MTSTLARPSLPLIFMILVVPTVAASSDPPLSSRDEPDDRLPRHERILVEQLSQQGMPELVEQLLAEAPTMHLVHVGRAYAQAARREHDAATREQFLGKAVDAYQQAIRLENDSSWCCGIRRGFDLVQWKVELADLIVRQVCAPDMDRYEITSGHDFDRTRLLKRLKEAEQLHRAAREQLDEIVIDARRNEQTYLLLGLGGKVDRLSREAMIGSAWTSLLIGMLSERGTHGRRVRLDSAIGLFDLISRTEQDAHRKYNATLGAAIALRESDRTTEAEAAFNRVLESTMPDGLLARARHEKARLHMQRERFDRAREELSTLAHLPGGKEEKDSAFYVQLAPVLLAYTDILDAGASHCPPAQKAELQKLATSRLMEIAERGGVWTAVAQVYLALMDDEGGAPSALEDGELFLTGSRLMAGKKYARGVDIWTELLRRPGAVDRHNQARFNLGICQIQLGEEAAAAKTLKQVFDDAREGELAERAAASWYQCLRRLAGAANDKAVYGELGEAAEVFCQAFPTHELAAEARWVGALAWQESGELDKALAAFKAVSRDHDRYWEARYREALVRQQVYDLFPAAEDTSRRHQLALDAAKVWRKFGDDLDRAQAVASKGEPPVNYPGSGRIALWRREASLAAAGLYASAEVRQYDQALELLPEMDETPRALGLRLRCLLGVGREAEAQALLSRVLASALESDSIGTLLDLAVRMERQMLALRASGHRRQTLQVAEDAIPVLRKLLELLQDDAKGRQDKEVVRFSLAQALGEAGRFEEARELYDQLISRDPFNGAYIRAAALMEEDVAPHLSGKERRESEDRAEKFWSRLLEDTSLRERIPDQYWEARYHWLRHQLRQGKADLVTRGIESERVWYPDLGGPPWQDKLHELATEAGRLASEK